MILYNYSLKKNIMNRADRLQPKKVTKHLGFQFTIVLEDDQEKLDICVTKQSKYKRISKVGKCTAKTGNILTYLMKSKLLSALYDGRFLDFRTVLPKGSEVTDMLRFGRFNRGNIKGRDVTSAKISKNSKYLALETVKGPLILIRSLVGDKSYGYGKLNPKYHDLPSDETEWTTVPILDMSDSALYSVRFFVPHKRHFTRFLFKDRDDAKPVYIQVPVQFKGYREGRKCPFCPLG